ncbi:MAG TPA: hypothetical protein VNI01_00515, partial [Elusimicrobiota bacterium]|nr:hypothetical protein [Elusimicrobiota bacterium]
LASDLEAMRRLSAAIGRGESLGAFRRRLGGTNVFLEARSRVFPPEARREMLAAVVDVVARLDGRQDEADYRAVMNVLDAFNFINADPATRELVRSRLVPLLAADPDGEGGAAAATRRRFVYDALWPLGVHAWTDLSEREVFRPFTAALVREARDESLPAAVRMESLRILTDALPGYDGYLARAPYIVPNVLSPIRDLANAGDGEVNRRAVAALRRVLESESHDHRLTGMEPWAHSYFRAEEFLRSGRIVRAREIPQEEWSPGMR